MKLFYLFATFFLVWHSSCRFDTAPNLTNGYVDRFVGIDSALPFHGFGEETVIPQKKPPKAKGPTASFQCPRSMSLILPGFPTKVEATKDSNSFYIVRSTSKQPDRDLEFETAALTPNGQELTQGMMAVCKTMEDNFSLGDGIKFSEVYYRFEIEELFKKNEAGPIRTQYNLTLPPFTKDAQTEFWLLTICNFTGKSHYGSRGPTGDTPYINVIPFPKSCLFSLKDIGTHEDESGTYTVGINGFFMPLSTEEIIIGLDRIYFEEK